MRHLFRCSDTPKDSGEEPNCAALQIQWTDSGQKTVVDLRLCYLAFSDFSGYPFTMSMSSFLLTS